MSTINVTNLSGRGGGTPNLPDGAVISGVATVTNLKPTNVNVSGAVTATTFDGSLKSTGTPTLGLGVTINSSGINVSGVLTATTFKGDGSNLTGVGESTAPWYYNPDVNDVSTDVGTGIGITFNKRILAGSGTVTIKMVNAGAAGTTVQSWGVSSCTFDVQKFNLGSLVSNLDNDKTYQLDIPDGFIVDGAGVSYVGTSYTFTAVASEYKLFGIGNGTRGQLGQNTEIQYSSPVQIPGTTWDGTISPGGGYLHAVQAKTDGTLWSLGYGGKGELGVNSQAQYSSPIQVPGTTWSASVSSGLKWTAAVKTDGTLWTWGENDSGYLGQNTAGNPGKRSSPVQVPGTTWPKTGDKKMSADIYRGIAVKTDGTLWTWGNNSYGDLAVNSQVQYSSPVQVPGTTWSSVLAGGEYHSGAIKTDGTLWTWGANPAGQLGLNDRTQRSSPTQIPGTTWSNGTFADTAGVAIKTDGTMWVWGDNQYGELGLNQGSPTTISSPTQLPGTTWSYVVGGVIDHHVHAIKTDGTLWAWGRNSSSGVLGQNDIVDRSSPVQIGSDGGYLKLLPMSGAILVTQLDATP